MSTANIVQLETFADRLRRARKLKILTQPQLAELIDSSNGSVGNWESGSAQPRPDTLRKIAEILDVSPAFLLYGESSLSGFPKGRLGESANPADQALRLQCREHFERFLATCQTGAQLGWLYCELVSRFPEAKFAPPAAPAVAEPDPESSSGAAKLLMQVSASHNKVGDGQTP